MLPWQKWAWWGEGVGLGGGFGCFSCSSTSIQSLYSETNTASCWEYTAEHDRLPSCPQGVRFCLAWIWTTGHLGTTVLWKLEVQEWSSSGHTRQGECEALTVVSRGPGGGLGSALLKPSLIDVVDVWPRVQLPSPANLRVSVRVTTALSLLTCMKKRFNSALKTIQKTNYLRHSKLNTTILWCQNPMAENSWRNCRKRTGQKHLVRQG